MPISVVRLCNIYLCSAIVLLVCTYFTIAFGLIFQPLGEGGVKWPTIQLHLNLYTGPGFLQAFLCIMNILVLVFFFKEFNVHGTKRKIPLKELCKWCSRIAKKNKEGSKMSRMDNSVGELYSFLLVLRHCFFKVGSVI